MEEKPLSQQESLLIIQKMIDTAKIEQKDDGMGWIIWGWLLFLASMLSYINTFQNWFDQYFFWNMFGIATLILLIVGVCRFFLKEKRNRVKTYTGDLFDKLNIGFFVMIMFLIVAMNNGMGPIMGFKMMIALYGFWVLIYGTALNFMPSVIAAFIMWAIGFVSLFFVKTFEQVMLAHALAVLCGYIIPGYMANREFKKVRSNRV